VKKLVLTLCATIGLLTLTGCAPSRPPVPAGEIPPANTVSPTDEQYGQQVLSTLMQQFPLERDDGAINRVRDMIDRLADAAGATHDPWHVYVLRGDNVVNAAATRGNFVFVWTGMLNSVSSDGELVTVLAHEMGHVLANHTMPTPQEEAAEIMAQATGEVAGRVVAMQGPYGALSQLAAILAQEAVKALVVNPESQRKELEADQIGLFLMADAGFNPDEAITLWSKMDQLGNADLGPMSFLSSHPANDERLEQLRSLLPAAEERYRTAISLPPPSKSKKRRPQYEPDTFSVGRDRSSKQRNEWAIDEPAASKGR
jgi:predicted Zn-dependent protease